MTDLILHEDPVSGNCYKIRLVAAHLGIALDRRSYDIRKGETRTPEFLAQVDANGRIPVLQIGDHFLPESAAACLYLAHGSTLIPEDRFDRADMMRWMFWEQYSHEPNVATLRFWRHFIGEDALSPAQRALIPGKKAAGDAALALMDRHLATRDWFAADRFTLADVALYAYTHVANEGGFDLSAYPAVTAWLTRVATLPGHIALDD
ncbi:glutathione S-transferase family protein [Sphingomonas sp. SUN019]|uniref:glutathione S-transferase family protein n=1 Tax=Sphingomonas sp. SUN019 TaxID=2937788 RepID=UPI0021643ED3|nr:glutathione S-transferase family protein [Sphingomonas sp. SUN019]UVO50861.1 glutathione S-transferase family protein [Sphingomonas sp. SUN019]